MGWRLLRICYAPSKTGQHVQTPDHDTSQGEEAAFVSHRVTLNQGAKVDSRKAGTRQMTIFPRELVLLVLLVT